MSLPEHERIVAEIRSARIVASPALRERVLALASAPPAPPRRQLPWRRMTLVLVPACAALAVAGALAYGLATSGKQPRAVAHGSVASPEEAPQTLQAQDQAAPKGASGGGAFQASPGRAQQYEAELTLKVKDLSAATKRALRLTRGFHGFCAGNDRRPARLDPGRPAAARPALPAAAVAPRLDCQAAGPPGEPGALGRRPREARSRAGRGAEALGRAPAGAVPSAAPDELRDRFARVAQRGRSRCDAARSGADRPRASPLRRDPARRAESARLRPRRRRAAPPARRRGARRRAAAAPSGRGAAPRALRTRPKIVTRPALNFRDSPQDCPLSYRGRS
jgi:hypothetical protein